MTKTTYYPSKTELQGAPEKFLYELMMFRAAINLHIEHSTQTNPVLCNVTLESALIHARNLYGFFCGEESWEDNIIAGHFIKNSDGTHWKSSALSYIASRRNDINKALSHLTYARVKNKPSWHIKHIMQDIESAYGEFLALLPEREYSKWQA